MTVRKGDRFLVERPLPCHVGIWWAAPYSTGHPGVLPAGEVIERADDPVEGASAGTFTPLRHKELEPWLVGTADPRMRKYQGYSLAVEVDRLESHCRPVTGEPPPPRDYESPAVYRTETVEVTAVGVLAADRRYFLEGIESVEVREHRASRKAAGYLLLVGAILLFAIIGVAFIAGAIALYLYKRYDVMIGYGGGEERVGRFGRRDEAEALAAVLRKPK